MFKKDYNYVKFKKSIALKKYIVYNKYRCINKSKILIIFYREFGGIIDMKKSKIFTSLVLIACVVFLLGTIAVYADTTPTTITTITTTSGNNTVENETSNEAKNTTVNNTPNTITIGGGTTNNSSNNSANRLGAATTNNSSTTTDKNLPYTGSNYSIAFVIVALGISAVYAYRKITEYNV